MAERMMEETDVSGALGTQTGPEDLEISRAAKIAQAGVGVGKRAPGSGRWAGNRDPGSSSSGDTHAIYLAEVKSTSRMALCLSTRSPPQQNASTGVNVDELVPGKAGGEG